jgi:SAM-dependent methyltransferase
VDDFRELVARLPCAGPLAVDWSCGGCGARFDAPDGFPPCGSRATNGPMRCAFLRTGAISRLSTARRLHALRARGAPLPRLIDRAIAGDARIVDVGCGTGQMCLFLARADRLVASAPT